jgi:hypothetical protein
LCTRPDKHICYFAGYLNQKQTTQTPLRASANHVLEVSSSLHDAKDNSTRSSRVLDFCVYDGSIESHATTLFAPGLVSPLSSEPKVQRTTNEELGYVGRCNALKSITARTNPQSQQPHTASLLRRIRENRDGEEASFVIGIQHRSTRRRARRL